MNTVATHAGLSEREARFVEAILSGCTRTEAARLAGYGTTHDSQRVQGSRLMRRPKIISALQEARAKQLQADGHDQVMDSSEVLDRMSHLARYGESERLRLDALNSLARYHALFTDRLQVDDERQKAEQARVVAEIADRLNRGLYGKGEAA